jgi:toluene monooxygenase system protein D|tara:strand:- start:825 stop:1133 length:309 start_codon:yes stop_codon:yes gene_type:complete
MSRNDDVLLNNRVGPVMRSGEIADAVIEAAELDNPDKEIKVEDMHAYLRISTESEMILTRESIEECLGRPFRMQELEVNLSSFAGKIKSGTEQFRFYFTSTL